MSLAPTKPWQARLQEMDHSKGTSNKMMQAAMQSEISDLRKLLQPELVEWRKTKLEVLKRTKTEDDLRKVVGDLRTKIRAQKSSLKQLRQSREEWKVQALKYQKQIIERAP